jgi:hypothetical protein
VLKVERDVLSGFKVKRKNELSRKLSVNFFLPIIHPSGEFDMT